MSNITVYVETVSGPLKKPVPPPSLPTQPQELLIDFKNPFAVNGIVLKTPLDVFKWSGAKYSKYEELAGMLKTKHDEDCKAYAIKLSEWQSKIYGPISHYLSFEASNASAGSTFVVRTVDTLSLVRVKIQDIYATQDHRQIINLT